MLNIRIIYVNICSFFFIVFTAVFFLISCENHGTEVSKSEHIPQLVYSQNYGCVILTAAATSNDSVLSNWYYRSDTLVFDLVYNANCCSEFKDSIAVNLPEAVAINLVDTTDTLCRCQCNHQSHFRFYAPKLNSIRISCAYQELYQPFVPILDTLLIVSGTAEN